MDSRAEQARGQSGPSPLIDAVAAAQLLGVPESWIREQARREAIPHIRLGRYVRFEAEALSAWSRQRRRGPIVDTAGEGA